jgi:hypothetical protein
MEDRAGELGGVARHVSGQGPRRFTTCGLAPLLPFSNGPGTTHPRYHEAHRMIGCDAYHSGDPSMAAKPNGSPGSYHTSEMVYMGRAASK